MIKRSVYRLHDAVLTTVEYPAGFKHELCTSQDEGGAYFSITEGKFKAQWRSTEAKAHPEEWEGVLFASGDALKINCFETLTACKTTRVIPLEEETHLLENLGRRLYAECLAAEPFTQVESRTFGEPVPVPEPDEVVFSGPLASRLQELNFPPEERFTDGIEYRKHLRRQRRAQVRSGQ